MKAVRLALFLGLLLFPALAQAQNLELTAYGGYNLGGSIDLTENNSTHKLNTSDSFATGLSLTWQRGPSNAFELYWGYRPTHIEGKNLTNQTTQFTTLNEHDFHANFLFMPAYRESEFTPFLLLGLGATLLDPGDVAGVSPSSATKFSWAIGAGVKGFVSDTFGLRAQVRYHSTYLTDQNGGTWCDPWYGCYQTVDTNWLDEWDFNGGIMLRLGRM
jgi:opacity protein-like surface antigen